MYTYIISGITNNVTTINYSLRWKHSLFNMERNMTVIRKIERNMIKCKLLYASFNKGLMKCNDIRRLIANR